MINIVPNKKKVPNSDLLIFVIQSEDFKAGGITGELESRIVIFSTLIKMSSSQDPFLDVEFTPPGDQKSFFLQTFVINSDPRLLFT